MPGTKYNAHSIGNRGHTCCSNLTLGKISGSNKEDVEVHKKAINQ